MADCCEDKSCALEALRERQSATLKIVLAINAAMSAVRRDARANGSPANFGGERWSEPKLRLRRSLLLMLLWAFLAQPRIPPKA